MQRRARIRRTGILCLHFLRNAAYYRVRNAAPEARRREQFWRTINGNFIDTCALEWCKLFGDSKAQHHWSKSVSDSEAFLAGLWTRTRLDIATFETYRLDVRKYRDKFVAHLDELNCIDVPSLQPGIESVSYLYDYLVTEEDDVNALHDAPRSASARYEEHLREGCDAHRA
jgi:hypothetical protein